MDKNNMTPRKMLEAVIEESSHCVQNKISYALIMATEEHCLVGYNSSNEDGTLTEITDGMFQAMVTYLVNVGGVKPEYMYAILEPRLRSVVQDYKVGNPFRKSSGVKNSVVKSHYLIIVFNLRKKNLFVTFSLTVWEYYYHI